MNGLCPQTGRATIHNYLRVSGSALHQIGVGQQLTREAVPSPDERFATARDRVEQAGVLVGPLQELGEVAVALRQAAGVVVDEG